MKVRAKVTGIYAGQRRRPGTVFTIKNEKELGSWMEPVPDDVKPAPVKVEAPKQSTMSEIAKAPVKGPVTSKVDFNK